MSALARPLARPPPVFTAAPVPSPTSAAEWKHEPSTLAVLFGLRLPYRPPRSPAAAFLWRRRLWFETTFALSMIQPWEKVLVLLISYATLLFVLLAAYAYLPAHLTYLRARAAYYLLGAEPDPRLASAWGAVAGFVADWNASVAPAAVSEL